MTQPTIDELLAGSDPWARADDDRLLASVSDLVSESRRLPSRPRRLLWIIPAVVAGGLALTAGALAVDNALFPDLPIAIEYTTDSGVSVSCTAQIEGGSMFVADSDRVVRYFESRDLSGLGQQIYDHAMVLTGDHAPTAENTPASDTWIPGEGNWLDDDFAFSMSLNDYLIINTQIDLGLSGDGGWLSSDCTGQLR